MTAPLGTAANRFTGIREFGQVTNTYAGYMQSAGAAYTLTTPFQTDKFEWYRYTGFGTAGVLGQGIWFRDFPAGDTLLLRSIADNGVTGNTSQLLETTNGVTIADLSGGFTNEHLVISGISTATPGVVTTSTAHGLTTGMRVVITKVIGTIGPSVNNQTFVVNVLTSTTFSLYDTFGIPVPTVGTYTSSGQVTIAGPELGTENSPPTYRLTLGTSIMGADNDVIYFVCTHFNNYVNLGDLA